MLIAAFFSVSGSAVVVVDGAGSSAVAGWRTVFGFAVVVRDRHHVEVDAVVGEASRNRVMVLCAVREEK